MALCRINGLYAFKKRNQKVFKWSDGGAPPMICVPANPNVYAHFSAGSIIMYVNCTENVYNYLNRYDFLSSTGLVSAFAFADDSFDEWLRVL